MPISDTPPEGGPTDDQTAAPAQDATVEAVPESAPAAAARKRAARVKKLAEPPVTEVIEVTVDEPPVRARRRPAATAAAPTAAGAHPEQPAEPEQAPEAVAPAPMVRRTTARRRVAAAAPVDTVPVDTAPADTAPADTAPVDTVPVDTAPADTAPADTAASETGPPAPPQRRPRTRRAPVAEPVAGPVTGATPEPTPEPIPGAAAEPVADVPAEPAEAVVEAARPRRSRSSTRRTVRPAAAPQVPDADAAATEPVAAETTAAETTTAETTTAETTAAETTAAETAAVETTAPARPARKRTTARRAPEPLQLPLVEPTPGAEPTPAVEAVTTTAPDVHDVVSDDALDGEEVDDPRPHQHLGHRVTAVVVSHEGARWLRFALPALGAQTRPVDAVVAADTGSTDASVALLTASGLLGPEGPRSLPSGAGFGTAVAAALAGQRRVGADGTDGDAGARTEWVWILHDDCAPAPDALERLLDTVAASPSVAIAGPKVRDWHDRRHLLEAGTTIARSGRRETGLEPLEQDQGQRDSIRDVLSVSSAGMLVRRDVWDALGGFDPRLPLFRDDLDLCWRATLAGHRVALASDAVVYHVEAAARGRREIGVAPHRPNLLDRRAGLFALLANLPASSLPFAVLRLLVGSLVRTVGFLVGKLPGTAVDELRALGGSLGRPDRVVAARAARASTRTVPARAALPMLAPRSTQVRHGLDALAAVVGGRVSRDGVDAWGAQPGGYDDEDGPSLALRGTGWLRRTLTRPGLLLSLGLVLLTLLARGDLVGSGRLLGGALLPAPDGAGDLWAAYRAGWHTVELGSSTSSAPYIAVVAALASLLRGQAPLAVDVLVVGAVPLAGAGAYLLLCRLVAGRWLRVWGAAAYALLPAVTGAVAAGRLGTTGLAVVLPFLGLALRRAFPVEDDEGRGRAFGAAWTAGLLLAVGVAFAPVTYLLALMTGVIALVALLTGRHVVAALRVLAVLVVPPVLLLPWTLQAVRHPGALLLEAGLPGPGLTQDRLPGYAVLLLHPGGPGMYPVLASTGLVLAGLAALLRADRRRPVLAAWAVALPALVVAVVLSRMHVRPSAGAASVLAWPGPALLVAGGALVVAAVVGGEGSRSRLAGRSFSWRQPLAVAVTTLAAAVPILAAGSWVARGADGPLQRRDPVLLPAFVAADGQRPEAPRTLVLRRPTPGAPLGFTLLRDVGPRLGDAETAPAVSTDARLAAAVAGLAAGRSGGAAALTPFGIRYVLVSKPVPAALAKTLDGLPGLVRQSAAGGTALWTLSFPSGRLQVVDVGTGAVLRVMGSDGLAARGLAPAGSAPRLLVLAERADRHWHATLDGRPLASTSYAGYAQAWTLPPLGGHVEVSYDDSSRRAWLWLELAAFVVVLVLALPGARRRSVDGEPADDALDMAPGGTPGPVAPAVAAVAAAAATEVSA